jgi:hypothetical protein
MSSHQSGKDVGTLRFAHPALALSTSSFEPTRPREARPDDKLRDAVQNLSATRFCTAQITGAARHAES